MLLQTQYTNNQIKLLAFFYIASLLCGDTVHSRQHALSPYACRSLVDYRTLHWKAQQFEC